MARGKFKKIGDWEKVNAAIEKVAAKIEKAKEDFLKELGELALSKLKGHIDAQDLGWRPLSQAYIDSKDAAGYSTDTWIRSGKLYDSLSIISIPSGVGIGVPEGEKTDEGEEVSMIAAVQEFGALSVGIYERPLFRPTMEEIITWIEEQNPMQDVIDGLA